jgi:hypothetical protein
MEQTLHSPSHGSEEAPMKKKFKKNIFGLLFGPFKNGIVYSFYAYKGGGLQKITNVEMINFPVGNANCQ